MATVERTKAERDCGRAVHTPHHSLLVALARGQVPEEYLRCAFALSEAEIAQAKDEASHAPAWD